MEKVDYEKLSCYERVNFLKLQIQQIINGCKKYIKPLIHSNFENVIFTWKDDGEGNILNERSYLILPDSLEIFDW